MSNSLAIKRFVGSSALLAVAFWVLSGSVSLSLAARPSDVIPAPTKKTIPPVEANAAVEKKDCVVLLHGLARRAASMKDMKKALEGAGFLVVNMDYPSREKPIEELAPTVGVGADMCAAADGGTVHFVAHSLGGIMIRQYLKTNTIENFGRAVMLGPPNHGSEVVDAMRDVPGYVWLNGPAGLQLGTDESSVPLSLGSVDFDVAVIAGTSSINLILSTHLPDPDDGKVSVASARLEGMCAMLEVDVAHPFLMTDDNILVEVESYLSTGRFVSEAAEYPECGHAFNP